MKTQYPMIPFPLIVKATDGDTEAINQILHHYRGYITKRSLRLMKDEYTGKSNPGYANTGRSPPIKYLSTNY